MCAEHSLGQMNSWRSVVPGMRQQSSQQPAFENAQLCLRLCVFFHALAQVRHVPACEIAEVGVCVGELGCRQPEKRQGRAWPEHGTQDTSRRRCVAQIGTCSRTAQNAQGEFISEKVTRVGQLPHGDLPESKYQMHIARGHNVLGRASPALGEVSRHPELADPGTEQGVR